MRIEFKIEGDGFKELAKLVKKLEVFAAANSMLYIIMQRPNEDNPHGVIRFYIDGVSQTMVMLDCNFYLSHMTYKSIEDYAVFEMPVEEFFKFIATIEGYDSQYVFSLKKKGEFKFLQVEIPELEHTYRTIIAQTSIVRIGVWVPIIDPEYKIRVSRTSFLQIFSWTSHFQLSLEDTYLISFGKNADNRNYFDMKVVLERDSEFDVNCKVEPEVGGEVSDERNIGKLGFEIMRKVIGFNEPIYFLKKKEESEYCFDINGSNYHIQVKFPTSSLLPEERINFGKAPLQQEKDKPIKIESQDI